MVGASALGLLGCYDTTVPAPPSVVFALFDPAGMPPIIPVPNDLTMMAASPTSPAVAFFSGAVNPASIGPQSLFVLDAGAMAPLTPSSVTFDATMNRLIIAPPAGGWPVGHRVAVALRGSPGGLTGVGGVPVVASPAFFFVRSPVPISNCTMPAANCTSATPVLTVPQAIGLEQLRQLLAPLIGALEKLGVPRGELVLAWTFTVGPPSSDGGVPPDMAVPTDAASRDGGG